LIFCKNCIIFGNIRAKIFPSIEPKMTALSLQTTISDEQLYALLQQLSVEEKYQLANLLRAQASKEEWAQLSELLPDVEGVDEEDVLAEIKAYRAEKDQVH
jgi:hypothetical protein